MKEVKVFCPFCGKEAELVEYSAIYRKNYGYSYYYLCKDCHAYVACDNYTRRPLGTMANPELRELRQRVHAVIDPIWRSRKLSRQVVYTKLSDMLGYEYHTAEADIPTCKKILESFNEVFGID